MICLLDDQFSQLNLFLTQKKPSKILILVDENTHTHCLPILLANLETSVVFEIVELESGEENKTIEIATQVWELCSEFELDRKALIINLGGGVICDLGGFVASTYKRGLSFVNIPTTLLAMCDASVGGKTGVNHRFLKNIIGTFVSADCVFIFPDFLKTLEHRELKSGFAEMLKHGLIADATHWQDLIAIKELVYPNLIPHITKSVAIKQSIVEQDFTEQNLRKNLNFGHSVGHAAESFLLSHGKHVTHGECVAMGMLCELHLSYQLGLISETLLKNLVHEITRFYEKLDLKPENNPELLNLMKNDKKNENSCHLFSLISKIGNGEYNQKVKDDQILRSLDYYHEL